MADKPKSKPAPAKPADDDAEWLAYLQSLEAPTKEHAELIKLLAGGVRK